MFSYKIVLVGNFGVGKTSLIRRFVENSFSEEYLSTIGVSISKKTIDDATIMIWDIEGHTEFKPIYKQYLLGAKGFIIVADLLREESIDAIESHIKLSHEVVKEAPVCIALNKSDMPHTLDDEKLNHIKNLSPSVIKTLKTSAKNGDAVEELFLALNEVICRQLS
ncbi:MAG TPA: GTP-binding protein [Sulfurimonas autotrophica]|uniref:GTP-binding protein n=1 Tax=Sulfurimonas autotrophica TaxID=202747 RepID=A0A7C3C191_9BACT|nr:GTP-binding protein [Sulfurimonas autotrophica]